MSLSTDALLNVGADFIERIADDELSRSKAVIAPRRVMLSAPPTREVHRERDCRRIVFRARSIWCNQIDLWLQMLRTHSAEVVSSPPSMELS